MPLDVEMGDYDSSFFDDQIDLDPAIASSVTTGPERVIYNCKDYVRRVAIYAAEVGGSARNMRGEEGVFGAVVLWANRAVIVYPRGQRFRRLPGGR
jgi:hypothetical protein